MAMKPSTRFLLLLLSTAFVPVHAELGGNETGISNDVAIARMQLRAVVPVGTHYRIHDLTDETGTVNVREYVNPDGKVFGVAWDGPTKPDLRQLLGAYFERYSSAAAKHTLVQQLRSMDQPDFALRVSGHMRHFSGSAWVPSLIPTNVTPADVK
jgi:hypothetical protein